jgi:transcriptional regulator with GAF, ATPase, and Fis domain
MRDDQQGLRTIQHAIVRILPQQSRHVTQAAKMLGLSRDALRYRIEKYSIRSKSQ